MVVINIFDVVITTVVDSSEVEHEALFIFVLVSSVCEVSLEVL
jgi:hypothetical protein